MLRTYTVEGIILATYRIGEIHKGISLFTREQGMLGLIAHGACKTKGKMRALTEVFNHIKAYVYHDPVKDSSKLTDVESISVWPAFRASIGKFYAASLFAEMAIKSHAGGESNAELFDLILEAYAELDRAAVQFIKPVILQFCLRFLSTIGHPAGSAECRVCGREFGETETQYYSRTGHGFVCAACTQETRLMLTPWARKYWEKTGDLAFNEAVVVEIEKHAAAAFSSLVLILVQEALEKELVTLASTGVGDW